MQSGCCEGMRCPSTIAFSEQLERDMRCYSAGEPQDASASLAAKTRLRLKHLPLRSTAISCGFSGDAG
jgi:hypothetical protein